MKPYSRIAVLLSTLGNVVQSESMLADKEHLNIYVNQYAANISERMAGSDRLSMLYVCHTGLDPAEQEQNWSVLDNMMLMVLEQLDGGYVDTYVFDCADKEDWGDIDPNVNIGNICDKEPFQPVFSLFKPPEIKTNPYTGKPMPNENIPYSQNEVTDVIMKNWITNNIPDYTQRLSQRSDSDEFADEADISKVYLFSAKQKVPPIYKALATNYYNRLRFAFVQVESEIGADLGGEFDVEKWPTLLISTAEGEKIPYDGKMKLPALKEFVDSYALNVGEEKEDRVIGSKKQSTLSNQVDKSGYMLLTNPFDIEEKIIDDQKAAIVYVASKDNMMHSNVIEELASEYGDFINLAMYAVDDVQASSSDLKKEFKSTKLPLFRYYNNQKTGEDKRASSFNIVLPSEAFNAEFEGPMGSAIKEAILREVHDAYITDVKEVSEKVYNQLAGPAAREGKVVVNYIYDGEDERGVDFTYKAVTTDPILDGEYVFFATDSPSEYMIGENTLPALIGMLPMDEENPMPRVFSFQGLKEFQGNYKGIVATLLQMFPEKFEAWQLEQKKREFKKQHPTEDVSKGIGKIEPRNFGEVTSMQDWSDRCTSRRACAIALLPALSSPDYEAESQKERVEMLAELDAAAERQGLPVYYSWFNTTCHPEIFQWFDVDPNFVPTIVYYAVDVNKHANLIGKFEKESLQESEIKFKEGKLGLQDARVKQSEMILSDIADCSAHQLEIVEDDEDFLAEILAEEEARKAQEKDDVGYGGKKKKSKKDKKKKKKKAKSEERDEL